MRCLLNPSFILRIFSQSYGFSKCCEHSGKATDESLIFGSSQLREVVDQEIDYILHCGLG